MANAKELSEQRMSYRKIMAELARERAMVKGKGTIRKHADAAILELAMETAATAAKEPDREKRRQLTDRALRLFRRAHGRETGR
jgi:adenylate kinase